MPEDLLREAGLRGVSLENLDELRRRAREVVEREVKRRKYDRDRDVRARPDWPEDKPFLVLAGESGQGKTWQLARLALDLAREEGADKVLAVFLVSQGDAVRDLVQAADLLWKQAWDRDLSKTLDRVAVHLWEVRGDPGRSWLAVCADGVQSLSDARALIEIFDWEYWGVRLALSVPREIGVTLARERPAQVHLRILRDFTLPELREYLRRHGRSWETVPADVRDVLKRPLLAGLYTSLGSDPDWAPAREYELYKRSWQKIVSDLSEHPEDLVRVKRLALGLLNEEPHYPWTWEQLEQAGLIDEPRRRLEQAGWWIRTAEGVEVWHDRLLSWVLAEAIAEHGSGEEVCGRLMICLRSQKPRIGRILSYVPMDVLWLLSGNPARQGFVPNLIESLEEEDAFGHQALYHDLLPTLGSRIVPALIQRLRKVPGEESFYYARQAAKTISVALDEDRDSSDSSPKKLLVGLLEEGGTVREAAIEVLARHPTPQAIDPLWEIHKANSLALEKETHDIDDYTAQRNSFAALRACLELDPEWLRLKVSEATETDPTWELAYLLANLKNPLARSLWLGLKGEFFRKMPPHKLRSLAVCIHVFLDEEEVPRLESWLSVKQDWTDLKAFRSLAWVAPTRAVQLLASMPLENLSDHSFGSWLPILILKRPEETRQALRDRMVASGSDFWQVADLYIWYDETMDRETAELLLDRLSAEATWDSLRRPLRILSRLHRLDLLQVFEKLAGTELDRRLGELGASWVDSPDKPDLSELRSVLLKIGGLGIKRLIQAGLGSPDPNRQREALGWGRMFPEEIAAAAPRTPEAHAFLGEDRALVEAVVALEVNNPWQPSWWKDWLTNLWRLRRGRPPMTDEDLAPALEALESGDAGKRMRGLEAVSISGRADLLSRLPEWLEGLGELEKEQCRELDQRAGYLVHRLAGEATESVRKLSQVFDFGRFPSLLTNLYGKPGAEALPDRLEQHLLSHLGSGQFGAVEMDFALTLSRSRQLDLSILQAVWSYGKNDRGWNREVFWRAVARFDSEEVVGEDLWKASQDRNPMEDERLEAIPALAPLEPDVAFEVAARHLKEPGPSRNGFVRLLLELDAGQAVPLLIEQAAREQQTEVLWTIARALRDYGTAVERELLAVLESQDFRARSATVHLAGWQQPGFLEADLRRMAAEDPDDDIQWECLQALDRQNKQRCVLELTDAFRRAEGTARWSYLESILALGDPRLLVTENDPLWLGRILTEQLGVLEVHANWRLKKRFEEIKRYAEQRDRDQKD